MLKYQNKLLEYYFYYYHHHIAVEFFQDFVQLTTLFKWTLEINRN